MSNEVSNFTANDRDMSRANTAADLRILADKIEAEKVCEFIVVYQEDSLIKTIVDVPNKLSGIGMYDLGKSMLIADTLAGRVN